MKNASTALKAFIPSTRQFFEADLFTITPGPAQNFLRWSMDISKSGWLSNIIAPTGFTKAVADPQGGFTAAQILAPGSAGVDGYFIQRVGGDLSGAPSARSALLMSGNVGTFSIWLRTGSGTTSALALFFRVTDNTTTVNDQLRSIVVTPSWQQFSISRVLLPSLVATLNYIELFVRGSSPGTAPNTWDNSVPIIYAWAPQLEFRGKPGPYVATQAQPRHANAGPVPEVIRVTTCDQDMVWQGATYISGSAQNLLRFSQDLEVLPWSGGGSAGAPTLTPDATADPNGVASGADNVAFPSTSSIQESFFNQDTFFVPTAGVTYTASIWLRAASPLTIGLRFVQQTGENDNSTIVNVTTGWQRFPFTLTMGRVGTGNLLFRLQQGPSQSAKTLFAWGAQVEQSDTMGRYLPTYAIPQYGIGKISRSDLKWAVGLTVDTLDLNLDFPQLASQIATGFLDGARVQLDRLYGSSPTSLVDSVTLFAGNVADITPLGRTRTNCKLRSRLDLLNNSIPRNLYQSSCGWSLFDAGCTLNKLANGSAGTVLSGSTQFQINTGFSAAAGYGDMGTMVFMSGVLAGLAVTIKQWIQPGSAAQIIPTVPLPFLPAVGDNIVVFPGCDKTTATCTGKFSNLINFGGGGGGEPFVPAPEAAL